MRLTLLFLLTLPSLCIADDLPEIRDFDLETTSELGKQLYRIDKYAARATDILFEQELELQTYPVVGWIVTEGEEGVLVTFVGEYPDGLGGVFDIRPEALGDQRFQISDARKLSDEELARFKARQTAANAISAPCSDRYNSVVLPDPQGDSWLVYQLAATMDPNVILVGGHYRITVSEDGTEILQSDRLSNSCLALEKRGGDMPADAEPVMMVVTHLLSDKPIETHVFVSLLHEMDFAIGTPDRTIWKVSGDQISKLDR